MKKTIIDHFISNAESYPGKIALIHNERAVSYGDLAGKVFAAARMMVDRGIRTGDRIVLGATRRADFVAGYLAAHLINAIAVPVDPGIRKQNLEYILDQVRPALVFLPFDFAHRKTRIYRNKRLDAKPRSKLDILMPFPDDIADILFTTGTTGKPKGVVLTHRSIFAGAENTNAFIGNGREDCEIITLPLHHAFGLRRLRVAMMLGASAVLVDGFLFPDQIFGGLERWNATGISMVPAGLKVLLRLTGEKIGEYKDQLKYMEFGSSPMPLSDKQKLTGLLPRSRLCMHYGLTEAAANIFIEFHESSGKLESLGKPAPNIRIMIAKEDGSECAVNETGEILVKGEVLMNAYWNDPGRTRLAFAGDWLRTGDFGYCDADGYIYLTGRKDDIMNVSGKKVAPSEVEEAILEHEGISGAACLAVPDPGGMTDFVIKAFLAGAEGKHPPGKEDLTGFLRGKLEQYKIPAIIEYIPEIPRTKTGKIRRDLLKP